VPATVNLLTEAGTLGCPPRLIDLKNKKTLASPLSSPIEPAAVDPHPIEPGAPDPLWTCSLYSSSRVDLAGLRLLAPPELAKPP
jgi:hypothetical protein